jgi:FKBP-type peptidyl-prolyl cis-trans isomerase
LRKQYYILRKFCRIFTPNNITKNIIKTKNMTKRIIPIALLSAATIGITACGGGSGKFKSLNGLEYQIVKDVEGKNAAIGDIIEFNLVAKVDTLTLADSYRQGQPQVTKLDSARNVGDLVAIFPNMSPGDSATVNITCDTIMAHMQADQLTHKPEWMEKGKVIKIQVKLVSVKNEADFQKDMQAKQEEQMKKMEEQKAAQMPIDDQMLKDYFAKNNINAQKTESGVYYTIQKPGSGAAVAKGMMAGMKYTGKTLEGVPFDSNVDTSIGHHGTELLTFQVGAGQMIPGFDEGVQMLKKGAKATLYLPSPLAYGPNSPSPNVAPNSILIFEVEVAELKAAPENK